jgi:PPP family 3-phenylpropionic acid transporter
MWMRPGFVPRVAALYAAIFLYGGLQLPFLPLWLAAKEVPAAAMGVMLAVPMFARILSVPVVAREADRRTALRAALVLAAWGSVAGHTLLGLSHGTAAIMAAYALASLAYTPIMPLTDTYALKGLAVHGRAYGPVRLWGSAAFIAGSFLGGFLVDAFPPRDLIWPMVGALGLVAAAASLLQPEPATKSERPPAAASPLRNPGLLAVLIGASLIQASHSIYYIFSVLQWRADGLSGATIATLWALGVVAEILLFAVSGRLAVSPSAYMMIGAGGAALRWGAMAIDPPAAVLPFLQILHALSFGATHLGALTYVARCAPHGRAATAQGQLAVALSATGGIAAALSGVLYSGLGVRAYAVMALVAIAGGACALVAHRRAVVAV